MRADLGAPTCNTENSNPENPYPAGLLVKWKEITQVLIACGHVAELYRELNHRTGCEDATGGHASRQAYQSHEESCCGPAISNESQLIANDLENDRSICEFSSGDEDAEASSLDVGDIDDNIYNDLVVPPYLIDEAADLSIVYVPPSSPLLVEIHHFERQNNSITDLTFQETAVQI